MFSKCKCRSELNVDWVKPRYVMLVTSLKSNRLFGRSWWFDFLNISLYALCTLQSISVYFTSLMTYILTKPPYLLVIAATSLCTSPQTSVV